MGCAHAMPRADSLSLFAMGARAAPRSRHVLPGARSQLLRIARRGQPAEARLEDHALARRRRRRQLRLEPVELHAADAAAVWPPPAILSLEPGERVGRVGRVRVGLLQQREHLRTRSRGWMLTIWCVPAARGSPPKGTRSGGARRGALGAARRGAAHVHVSGRAGRVRDERDVVRVEHDDAPAGARGERVVQRRERRAARHQRRRQLRRVEAAQVVRTQREVERRRRRRSEAAALLVVRRQRGELRASGRVLGGERVAQLRDVRDAALRLPVLHRPLEHLQRVPKVARLARRDGRRQGGRCGCRRCRHRPLRS
eukprot:3802719-Prymnesium_polylepis.1